MKRIVETACLAAIFIGLSGCTSVRLDENLADYARDVSRLEREIVNQPTATEPLRDLGAIYMRTGNPVRAEEYLSAAFDLGGRDAKLLFYLGLASEGIGDLDTALEHYLRYPEVSRISPYRNLMEGRYAWLVRESALIEMQGRIAEEAELSDTDIEPNVVAVFPMTYQGSDPDYAPLGRGLAEMISLDLQNVNELRVVERARLQALIDELALGESGYVNPASAPRVGLLLQAGRIIGGTYNIVSGNNLRLDPAYVESPSGIAHSLSAETGGLDRFFELEKRLVFSLLDDLGIELTEAEQARIEEIPTQNLQAFLAYCRGLQREDERDFSSAATFFQQAISLDPQFSAADAGRGRNAGMRDTGGPGGDPLSGARRIEPPPPKPLNLMGNRMVQLAGGVQSPILPGVDQRQSATEQGMPPTIEPLRNPPPPPNQN